MGGAPVTSFFQANVGVDAVALVLFVSAVSQLVILHRKNEARKAERAEREWREAAEEHAKAAEANRDSDWRD
jgi:hypothetical protein